MFTYFLLKEDFKEDFKDVCIMNIQEMKRQFSGVLNLILCLWSVFMIEKHDWSVYYSKLGKWEYEHVCLWRSTLAY